MFQSTFDTFYRQLPFSCFKYFFCTFQAAKEAKEAEELAKELAVDENDSLKSLILKKQQSREKEADNFFAHLEAKYAKPKKGKGKKGK